ncbi:succinylglutamate desuccinylase/aspartoacylase family protein [Zunongwangia endophytica]|uniref:Succinylglutamate desuccinylase/aspartoacylase family protein n=1 Tax=Zunongwangia endophytica TaxID=1808945 RepID=A0ABV8H8L9_9FLAO|nr:M14 family metallopeptidase [Zunongwangia endophytica]MDN3593512.1 M14 family metallopeptidase [Zunongwangia endophytica]
MNIIKSQLRRVLILLFISISAVGLAQQKNFEFAEHTIKPGSKTELMLPVSTANDSTVIPVTVFHGKEEGPVLGIVAGVHGTEFVPILAAQQLAKDIDPNNLSGTIILVHIANVEGFLNRSFRVNPIDQKNLNRVFPGEENGSMTERLAWTISNKIIPFCDFYIDVHAGDYNNDLRSYAGYYNYFDKPEVSNKAKDIAVAMGFPFIVQFGNQESLNNKATYTSREAFIQNIPAVDIECGRMGIVEENFVQRIQQALWNVMGHLNMMDFEVPKNETAVMIGERTTVNSQDTGFFYSDFTSGDYVKKGMKLGYTTDLFGNPLNDVICPVDGMILYKTFNPPIEKGDGLFNIGHID